MLDDDDGHFNAPPYRDEEMGDPSKEEELPTSPVGPMRTEARYRSICSVVLTPVLALCFVYFFHIRWSLAGRASSQWSLERWMGVGKWGPEGDIVVTAAEGTPRPGKQKITVIAIWDERGGKPPIYFPYFFQSVEANKDIDLLFITIDKTDKKNCTTYSNAPNVRELCLPEKHYFELHVDYLCKRWNCTDKDRKTLYDQIKQEEPKDVVHSFFRILRNGVFSQWIDPSTTIWGWCDSDTVWGNFSKVFPWEVSDNFDVLVAAGQPAYGDQRLLFARGHMSFFKNSPEITERLLSFPKFASLSSYLALPPTRLDAEESEFSHYIFNEPTFTFITFEGMVDSWDSVFLVPQAGVFYSPLKKADMSVSTRQLIAGILQSPRRQDPGPIFSEKGVEKEARVFPDGTNYKGGLWFPAEYATFVEPDWTVYEREQKAYFMRKVPGGPVMQRMEPRERYLYRDGSVYLDESLYKHWQIEKHEAWFHRIPVGGIQPNHIFAMFHSDEAEVWDASGQVIFETGKN